jgi:hypothetical protein
MTPYTDTELAYCVMRLGDGSGDRLGKIAAEIERDRSGLQQVLSRLGLPTTPVRARSADEQRADVQARAGELATLDREAVMAAVFEAQEQARKLARGREAVKARILELRRASG